MTMELVVFYIFAAITVIASLLVVSQHKPMHSVLLLIVSFGGLSGLYVLLDAPFTAVTQIIIYAGAIMPIAGLGLIGLAGAAIASCFLWDTDAQSYGVIREDNFALFINLILCLIGILTMVFSSDVVERENLPAGEYYALTLFAIAGMEYYRSSETSF